MKASKKVIALAFCYRQGDKQLCMCLPTSNMLIALVMFTEHFIKADINKPITQLLTIKVYLKK